MNKYNSISPTDFRYGVKCLNKYLSEAAFTKYKLSIEIALVKTLSKFGLCPIEVVKELEAITNKISTKEVYSEERIIKHDVRALVNVIKKYVSDDVKPYINFMATSSDIVDTARALMYKDSITNVILPDMIYLEKTWINLALREKDMIQIGRTHGQHAEPITFGFAIAQYVNRWGDRILNVKKSIENLIGKFSGSVGAYNASSLIVDDPEKFESELLAELGLKPSRISTQVIPYEPTVDLIHSIISSYGILANYADDMRHLQRTEIGEIAEFHEKEQVASSSMPHKRNPASLENVKSAWKEFMPRMTTVYMDQISEHQRDLTNSLSQRYIAELFVMFDFSLRKIQQISEKIIIDKRNLRRNYKICADKIIAEPLQVLLSYYGHPNAHEKVRQLVIKSYCLDKPMKDLVFEDEEIGLYLNKFAKEHVQVILDPKKYIGIASQKVIKVCDYWREILNSL